MRYLIKRMKISVILAFSLPSLLCHQPVLGQIWQGATVNTSVTKPAPSANEPYGINMSSNVYSPSDQQYESSVSTLSETFTRHRRLGQSTGIGNSFIQTSSPTSESRLPLTTYKDYNVSPAKSAVSPLVNFEVGPSFWQITTSPALSPVFRYDSKINSSNLGINFDSIPSLDRTFSGTGQSFTKMPNGLSNIGL